MHSVDFPKYKLFVYVGLFPPTVSQILGFRTRNSQVPRCACDDEICGAGLVGNESWARD